MGKPTEIASITSFASFLGVSKSALMRITTMLACSMGHSAYAQTLDHKKIVRKENALMVVQVTTTSGCVEGLDTSISSILMPTEPQLMIGAVETHCKTTITKNGMPIWPNVALQVNCVETF